MKYFAIPLLHAIMLVSLALAEEEQCDRTAATYPKDVAIFVEARCLCDHFRGEMGSGDKDRSDYVNAMADKYCKHSDTTLVELKRKYASDEKVSAKLQVYEANINGKE